MTQQEVDVFLAVNSKRFPEDRIYEIREALLRIDEAKSREIHMLQLKDPSNMLIISLFAGKLGIDRFMLGQTGLGLAKLLTCGGCGIWTIVDFFIIGKITKEINHEKLKAILQGPYLGEGYPNQ